MWVDGISVVIPVYNEQDNVEPLTQEIVSVFASLELPYEIIYVDDGSQDATFDQLKKLQGEYAAVQIVRNCVNSGQSAAVVRGVRHAAYPWIATLDGDRQNNPQDLAKLILATNEYTHSRVLCMGQRQERQDHWIRKISSKIANQVRSYFLKDFCQDSGCGIKIFPARAFLSLPLFKNCHRFLPILFRRAGYVVIYVPVSHRPRVAGVSKYGVLNRLGVGLVDLLGVSWLLRRFIELEEPASVE